MEGTRTPESKLLLAIINGHPTFQFTNVDLELFMELVRMHEVAPLVSDKLSDHVPDTAKDKCNDLKLEHFSSVHSNKQFWSAFLKILEAFSQQNVPLLPLKGVDMLARFYPFFDQRSMRDIDVLVRDEDYEKAEQIFVDLGYKKNLEGLRQEYWRKHQCHILFCKDEIRVDLHFGLDFKRNHRVLLPNLWDRTKTVNAADQKVRLLSPEDALFSFALHWRRFGNILSLKQVLDVARIIKESPDFEWDYIIKESGRGRMKATVYFILMQADIFCEAKIPKKIFQRLRIPFWQMAFIKKFIFKYTFEPRTSLKAAFLEAHFLLYDNILEPILYLLNIPYEQFCKFYGLKPYTSEADLRYRFRIPYMALSPLLHKKTK